MGRGTYLALGDPNMDCSERRSTQGAPFHCRTKRGRSSKRVNLKGPAPYDIAIQFDTRAELRPSTKAPLDRAINTKTEGKCSDFLRDR
jgi:hypothetical protein